MNKISLHSNYNRYCKRCDIFFYNEVNKCTFCHGFLILKTDWQRRFIEFRQFLKKIKELDF